MSFIERRKNKRVSDMLKLRIEPLPESTSCLPVSGTYVANLSVAGLGFSSRSPLPTNTYVRLTLELASLASPINLLAQIASCSKIKSSDNDRVYKTRMIFSEVDDSMQALLEQHIDAVIDLTSVIKELPYRKIA